MSKARDICNALQMGDVTDEQIEYLKNEWVQFYNNPSFWKGTIVIDIIRYSIEKEKNE